MAGWSSEWVNTDGTTAVENGATLTFTHNLGATDLIFTLYAADDNLGTNTIAIGVGSDLGNTGVTMAGAQIQSVSSTQVILQLGSSGYNTLNSTGHRVNGSETNYLGKFIKVLALNPLADPAPEAAGTEVKFIEPYDVTPVDGAWTKIDAQPAWINSNARTLVVKAETFDFDTGGNTTQYLKARTSAASTIEVDIITHGGTSGGRSVASEQALIPCSEDGSFEYYWYRDSPNGELRSFKVIGYVQRSPFIAGSGDLCKFFPDDSGYQMFRNGLTMQWMSSPAFTTESSQVINFPTPFAAKPFKVTASTRYPTNDGSSQQWFQVVAWNTASVTIRAQSQNVGSWTKPVYADIIAIGMTEAIGCIDGSAAASGTKISELKSIAELKDDDLFVLSRDKESDGSFDTSNNVKLGDIAKYVTPPEKTIIKVEQSFTQRTLGHTDSGGWKGADTAYTLVTNMSTGEAFASKFMPGYYNNPCSYPAIVSSDGWYRTILKSGLTPCSFNGSLAKAITDLAPILTEEQVRDLFDRPDFSEIFLFI